MKTRIIILSLALLVFIPATSFAKDMNLSNKAELERQKTTEKTERISKRFIHVLHEQFGVDEKDVSGGGLFLRDFGADSLDILELVMALEEEFDIVIEDDAWDGSTTVDSAVEFIAWETESRY